MSTIKHTLTVIASIVIMGASSCALAEAAPVFDADTMQQQAEADQPDNYPPPPAPETGYMQQSSNQTEIDAHPIRLSMDQRLQRLEQELTNLQNNDAGNKVDSIQGQVQVLRNQVEEMSHMLQQMQNQQRAAIADLTHRLESQPKEKPVVLAATSQQLDESAAIVDTAVTATASRIAHAAMATQTAQAQSAPAAPVQATPAQAAAKPVSVVPPPAAAKPAQDTASNQPNVAEEQQIYQTAYNLIKAKKYNEAVKALQGMLEKYPTGQFASNAHYWLGELYGLMGKNDLALSQFNDVVKTYPESPRVSDAQLKIGLLLAAEFKWADAKVAFKEVINRYPGTASSRLAAEQIKQIKQAGH